MNTARELSSPRPFVPADVPIDKALARVVMAHCLAANQGPGARAEAILRERWPRDAVAAALFTRAATSPASLTAGGWADTLAISAVGSFLGSLRDAAAAVLMARAPRVDLAGIGRMLLPGGGLAAGAAAWVLEGAALPVAEGTVGNAAIVPRKCGLISSISREMLESSGGELWMSIILSDAGTAALDVALFSSNPGSSTQPPGLAAGLTPVTAATGGGFAAATSDFRAVTDAIAAVAGGEILYFMSPGRAVAAKAYLPALASQILPSAFIPSAELFAVAVGAFCSGFDPTPEIVASRSAVVHFEDTSPLAIGTPGAPPTIAAPARSFFQTDSIGFRLILKGGWNLRVAGSAAWIQTGMSW